METLKEFINTFVTEDYFIIILLLLFIILVVLVMALIKAKKQFYELSKVDYAEDLFSSLKSEAKDIVLPANNTSSETMNNTINSSVNNIASEPIESKQSKIIEIKDYDDEINEYESNEEENAVISTYELEKKTQERMEELGVSDNQAMINKYEEEQEKKAIISYEQLLKNAANIRINYVEEDTPKGYPRINKIEVQEKVVTEAQSYIKEEEFLKILKEFRVSLPR